MIYSINVKYLQSVSLRPSDNTVDSVYPVTKSR